MIREYINNVNATQDSWVASNPYYFVRIDAINHGTNGIQKALISSFAASDYTEVVGTDDAGFNWMGLKNNDASASINFTKSFTIPATGYYLVELFIWKKPTVAGNFSLSIAGDTVWTESGYNKWSDYGTVVRVPIQYLTAGSKSFVLDVPKYAGAGWIKISQLTRYEGGKEIVDTSETRLDLIDAEFTQNGVNALDTLEIKVAMKEDYWTDEMGNNPIAFDAGDHVTVVLGQDSIEARPIFGGYVAGWVLNDDMTELTISCVDRLWDLSRTTIKKNFSIGYVPAADSAGTMPYTQFSSVAEIARYLCTALYHIDYRGILQDYKLYNSFSLASDVSALTSFGFDKKWETSFGHPGTCMRLMPTVAGPNYVTFFSDSNENWNAYNHPIFSFDYYASGAGIRYPVKFNIEIEMWKNGELPTSAQKYVIRFNGPTPTGTYKQLTQVTPNLNGEWQSFTINLKDAFDKVASSDEYWIKSVKLVGYQDSMTVMNRRCSSLYIDQIIGLGNISQAPKYASADSKSALVELQDMCEKCNQVAYTRPGMERSLDQLILLPQRYYTLPITIDSSNVVGVGGMEYRPIEWGIINQASDTFNYSETSSGTSKAYDENSEKHYGIIQDHEFLSDINTMAAAQVISKAKVANSGFQYPGFNAIINGSVLIEPGQYINVNLPQYHLNGSYEIQAITHKIDFTQEYFITELEFNRTTGAFYSMIKRMNNADKGMQWIRNSDKYATQGSIATGNTSLGAYSD